MTSWTNDEGLMEELAVAIGQERDVPAHHRQAAYGAFAWRTVDQDLLTLMHDSALQATAAVRGSEDARTLSFAGGEMRSSSRWTAPSSRGSCSFRGARRGHHGAGRRREPDGPHRRLGLLRAARRLGHRALRRRDRRGRAAHRVGRDLAVTPIARNAAAVASRTRSPRAACGPGAAPPRAPRRRPSRRARRASARRWPGR